MSAESGHDRRRAGRLQGRLGGSIAVLVAALALAVPLAWASHTFDDVPDASTHHADVTALKGAGITAGCNPPTNNLYCPDAAVRRDQMATFLRRGLGRTTRALGPTDTLVGSGAGSGPFIDLVSVTLAVPGTSGTQFVNIHGEASLFTNSTRAVACASSICNVYLYLYDGATQLARSFVRISGDQAGGTIGISAVQAVAAGTSKTYTLRAQGFNVNTNQAFAHQPRIIASSFPFGGSGGSTITAAPPADAGPDVTIGESR